MSLSLKGSGNFFALDIGTNAIRVVQLSKSGQDSWNLVHYGYASVDEKTSVANSVESVRRLGEIVMTAVGQSGIKRKDVVIGLPSSKTFTTVVDVPIMDPSELRSTIKYQTDQYIPIANDDAKVDWVALGQSMHDPKQQEVLLASTSNSFVEERLEFVEALGFNVVAAEPDPIAIVRSLLPLGIEDARLIIDMGDQSTDLVITYKDAPRLVRNIPIGLKTLIKASSQNLNTQDDQARQFILKFGLAPDKLEGQVFRAVENTLEGFAVELVKSVKFFQTRYPTIKVSGILLSGFSALIPQFGNYLSSKTGISSSVANPWQRVNVNPSDQQQLNSIASEFAAVIGLAQRNNIQ